MTEDECLFCRIARGALPVPLVASNDRCVAFRDIDPQAPLHVLVIPRKHLATLNDATDGATLGAMFLLAAEVAAAEGVAEGGYRTVVNTNRDAGQTVFHLHMHVLGGRRMSWPPG